LQYSFKTRRGLGQSGFLDKCYSFLNDHRLKGEGIQSEPKSVNFEVTPSTVKEQEILAIDDAFVVSLGKFENVESLKKNIQDGMLEEKKTVSR